MNKAIELSASGVRFVRETHQYFLGDKELHGITKMLTEQLFPSEYKGIDKEVLDRAAARGTFVHDACEMLDTLGICQDLAEVKNYRRLVNEGGLVHEATEYIVTDGEYYASPIDKVYRVSGDEFDLGDIKTVASLNKEKTAWQLSIYAYLFERQNPGAKVRNIFAIHLRSNDKEDIARLVQLERKPDEEVRALLEASRAGQVYKPASLPVEGLMPDGVALMQQTIIDKVQTIATLQGELDEIKAKLLELMNAGNVKSWEGDLIKITRKEGAVRQSFDHKKMRKEHPELADVFAKYDTQSTTKPSILITVKK